MLNWTQLLKPLADDIHRGASELYRDALRILAAHCDSAAHLAPEDRAALVSAIRSVHPEMAPFHFLADQLQREVDPAIHLAKLGKDLYQADQRITDIVRALSLDARPILLHSYSGTVVRAVESAFSRTTPIFISEAAPDHEGMLIARRLAAAGFAVTTFPDDARLSYLSESAVVFVGSDWIDESHFTNKIGTHSLFLAARSMKISAYVIAEQIKLAPLSRRVPRKSAIEIVSANLKYCRCLLEETPNPLATGFITDLGLYSAADIARQVETRKPSL